MRVVWVLPGILLGVLALTASRAPGQAPQLRIIAPKQGVVVNGSVPITVDAAQDLDVSFVVFGIDGNRPVSTNTRPFAWSWDTREYAEGPHLLSVEAYGAGGLIARAGPIQVIVRNNVPIARLSVPRGPVASRVIPIAHPKPVPTLAAPRSGPPPEMSASVGGVRLAIRVRLFAGEAYLQFRPVIERLDGFVTWDADAHTATAWCREREVQLTVGSDEAKLDGAPVKLYRAPTIDNSRLVLPARACAHLLGMPIAWDGQRRMIRLGDAPMARHPAPKGQQPQARRATPAQPHG